MKKGARKGKQTSAEYYDRRGVLGKLEKRPVEFALEEELREQILTRRLSGSGRRRTSAIGLRQRKALAKPVQRQGAPREYTRAEIQRFLKVDRLDPRVAAKVRRVPGRKPPV